MSSVTGENQSLTDVEYNPFTLIENNTCKSRLDLYYEIQI